MTWKCPVCGELGNSKKEVNCNCNSIPLNQNPKFKKPRVKKVTDLKLFCKGCNADIRTEDDKEWHTDLHGIYNIIPRKEAIEVKEKKDSRSTSKKIFDFAETKIEKIVISASNSDDVYALIKVNSHIETTNLGSRRSRHWLRSSYADSFISDEMPSDETYKNVLEQIIAKAQMNGTGKSNVYTRIAQTDNAIWYDLGNSKWQSIKITKEGIKTVSLDMKSPIFFRTQALSEQVIPVTTMEDSLHSDPLSDLCELMLIKKTDRTLFKINLVAMMLEKYPIPMIVFEGTSGTGKSTLSASIKKIIDPSGKAIEDNVISMAEKNDELIMQIHNRYLTCFDNVGFFKSNTSNILCRSITGSSNPKRKLYSDSDEVMMSFRRKIVLNGINPSLDFPDLQTRILMYGREEMTKKNRKSEKQYWKEFEELLPKVLGRIFIVLCKTMRKFDIVSSKMELNSRMADFEVWGEVISQVLGNKKNEFATLLQEKQTEGMIEMADQYPIVECITKLMKDFTVLEDTATNLFKKLSGMAVEDGIDIKNKNPISCETTG